MTTQELIEKHGIKEITTKQEAYNLFSCHEPEGLFFMYEDGKVIGIDNSDGDAWTEEFSSLDNCVKWLLDMEEKPGTPTPVSQWVLVKVYGLIVEGAEVHHSEESVLQAYKDYTSMDYKDVAAVGMDYRHESLREKYGGEAEEYDQTKIFEMGAAD
jgi:hypothetical protein